MEEYLDFGDGVSSMVFGLQLESDLWGSSVSQ